jgi:hypothetical protein
MAAVETDALIDDQVCENDDRQHDAGHEEWLELEYQNCGKREGDEHHVDDPDGAAAAPGFVGSAIRAVHIAEYVRPRGSPTSA